MTSPGEYERMPKGGKESAARSANLGGCKGRAANEGKGGEGKRADDDIVLQKKKKNPALNAGANNKVLTIKRKEKRKWQKSQ